MSWGEAVIVGLAEGLAGLVVGWFALAYLAERNSR